MKVQSSENKLVITEEFIFDQNKLPSDPNNHFKVMASLCSHYFIGYAGLPTRTTGNSGLWASICTILFPNNVSS